MITNTKLTDHIRIQQLREKTGLLPIMSDIKRKKLKLYGHLKRQTKGLAKLCIEGMVEGKREDQKPDGPIISRIGQEKTPII